MTTKTKSILVTGDITLDHYIQLGNRNFSDSARNKYGTGLSTIKGGAHMIYDFLTAFIDRKSIHFGLNQGLFAGLPAQNNSYATIALHKEGKEGKDEIWRIDRQLGFGTFSKDADYSNADPVKDTSAYDIVIIDDADMDFGSHVNQKSVWPRLESLNKPDGDRKGVELVICKKSGDLKKGELLKELLNASYEGNINLLSIVSINEIRRQDARVSSKISWEQTALDLVYELKNNIGLADLSKSKYLVVTIDSSGAVFVINKGDGEFEYKLIFDPLNLENEWEEKCNGSVIGLMSCFTAALTSKLNLEKPGKDYLLEDAIIYGLQSGRGFLNTGYLKKGEVMKLPLPGMLAATAKLTNSFSRAFIPVPGKNPDFLNCNWTILKDNYQENSAGSGKESIHPGQKAVGNRHSVTDESPLCNIARNVVMNGRAVLNNIPSLTLGKLFTVDRNEIESLRNIKMLIENYRDQKGIKIPPLSIAVFGLPGSGKSFGVKEIGKGVLGDKLPILEFNLSQFADPVDLIGAFHQVRDEVLKGTIPLVFWDEFDSNQYKWLQYLLAPMQDGIFQEGQVTHTIGKCIMVFAGATCYKMNNFGVFDELKDKDKIEDFKLKKGPDFISRIHGYVDILGPNPGLTWDKVTAKWEPDSSDTCYPVRRSLFIRQILGLGINEKLDIDWGLLNALLKVGKYRHGARSLSNLLKNLKDNSNGRKMRRCHLPSNTILELYIDKIPEFFEKLNENQRYLEHVFEIAPAIHAVFMRDAKTINPEYLKEFHMLPVFIKASNIDAAIRIPKVLAIARLKIVIKSENNAMTEEEYQEYLAAENNLLLEKMAEEEHKLWMKFYFDNDWHYNEQRNDYQKLHNCLVEYHSGKLSDGDKDKDRNQIMKYREFLTQAGFGIAKE